ncbi:MAG: EAL and HDOD domain-containing protein [Lawsonibacter sp.]
MYAYIARQPIFNLRKKISGYELLYRDGVSGNVANIIDGDSATCRLLSDALFLFGLSKLTNQHPAFINFTRNLIMDGFVEVTDPKEVIVEILEDVVVDADFLIQLKFLKDKGYTLALDDYVGNPKFKDVLPYVDIVKVDFRQTDQTYQRRLANQLKRQSVTLLAEKVETLEEFNAAVDMGYTLFQGYFFEKPKILNKRLPSLASSLYGRLLNELQHKEVDFSACAKIIHSDASLTYMVLRKVQTLAYYRGNLISGIKHGLVIMGTEEFRRWVILLLARQNNVTNSEELIRKAYLRGLFTQELMEHADDAPAGEDGFLLGIFSLLDQILGSRMEDLLVNLNLNDELKSALLGRTDNMHAQFLQYVWLYEMANPNLILPDLHLWIDDRAVAELYLQCMMEADAAFNDLEDSQSS